MNVLSIGVVHYPHDLIQKSFSTLTIWHLLMHFSFHRNEKNLESSITLVHIPILNRIMLQASMACYYWRFRAQNSKKWSKSRKLKNYKEQKIEKMKTWGNKYFFWKCKLITSTERFIFFQSFLRQFFSRKLKRYCIQVKRNRNHS